MYESFQKIPVKMYRKSRWRTAGITPYGDPRQPAFRTLKRCGQSAIAKRRTGGAASGDHQVWVEALAITLPKAKQAAAKSRQQITANHFRGARYRLIERRDHRRGQTNP